MSNCDQYRCCDKAAYYCGDAIWSLIWYHKMGQKKEKHIRKKRSNKIYSFNLSEAVIEQLNEKIGYSPRGRKSRSKAVEEIISNYVNKEKGVLPVPKGQQAVKTPGSQPGGL